MLLKEPPGWLRSLKLILIQVVKLLLQFIGLSAARNREDLIHTRVELLPGFKFTGKMVKLMEFTGKIGKAGKR
jgi:hypothetical protein